MKRFLLTDKLFLKLSFALAIGICSVEFLPFPFSLLIPILLLILLQIGVKVFKNIQPKLIEQIFYTLFIYLSMGLHFLNGAFHFQSQSTSFPLFVDKEVSYLFRIDEKPIKRSTSTKIQGELVAVKIGDSTFAVHSQMILYLPTEIPIEDWTYGDNISLYGKINPPIPPLNPEEFDYKKWLYRNHIYLTAYSANAKKIGNNANFIQKISYLPAKARDYFEMELAKFIPTKQNLDIAKSLLIGVRSDMEQEILDAYSATGTIHILSVSGTHFAVFFFMLSFLFKRISKRMPYTTFLSKQLLCFAYALITGFSPPVFRSFLMLFFVDFEQVTQSRSNPFNILFLTACLILLYNTHQLFDIGFLLSYQSVLGLMVFYKKIYNKIEISNWFGNKAWQIISGSFAAWMATLPLSIFFFHKFSLFGMMSNLFVVPVSFGVLCSGYIFLLVSKIPFLGFIFGWIIDTLLTIQNNIILFFEKIPFAFIDNLYLSAFQTLLFTLILFIFIKFLIQKTRHNLYLLGVLCLMLLGSQLIRNHYTTYTNGWIHFNLRKQTAFGYKYRRQFILFADSMDKKTFDFSIRPFVCYYDIDTIQKVPLHAQFKSIPMKLGISTSQNPENLILCKENKPFWKKKRQFESPIILSKNMGYYYKNKMKNEIQLAENQEMRIQDDTSQAFFWKE
jgi:competence protein ComEC